MNERLPIIWSVLTRTSRTRNSSIPWPTATSAVQIGQRLKGVSSWLLQKKPQTFNPCRNARRSRWPRTTYPILMVLSFRRQLFLNSKLNFFSAENLITLVAGTAWRVCRWLGRINANELTTFYSRGQLAAIWWMNGAGGEATGSYYYVVCFNLLSNDSKESVLYRKAVAQIQKANIPPIIHFCLNYFLHSRRHTLKIYLELS